MTPWDEFADRREEFAVLTVHAKDTGDFARLDPELEKLLGRWKRDEFPFPIVLDGSGATADGGTARLREILADGR